MPLSHTFYQFLSSVQGDLANITAPPQFLAPSSVVEVGHCWVQRPDVFAAPAQEPDPKKRSLLVLRLVLIALKSQLYVAGSPTVSIKKPLNAFLGEVFSASWTDSKTGTTAKLCSEQVSHHVSHCIFSLPSRAHAHANSAGSLPSPQCISHARSMAFEPTATPASR